MDQPKKTKAESGAVAKLSDLQPTYTLKDGTVVRKRILTGDRTTGKLHLGHYVGSLKNRVELQHKYDTFILMADVQALTTHWENPQILKESVREVALDYLAAGMDPYTGGVDDGSKPKIVIQSAVPAIAELTVLYGLITPMSLVLDNPTTKAEAQQYGMGMEKSPQEKDPNIGFVWVEFLEFLDLAVIPLIEAEFSELGEINGSEVLYAASEIHQAMTVSQAEEFVRARNEMIHDQKITDREDDYNEFIYTLERSKILRKEIRTEIVKNRRSSGLRQMNLGFLSYPVSQAADITFVNAHLVPVGDDQVPHIELTREIARRMNKQYGKRKRILTIPQALLGSGGTLKGLDGNAKMSKSLNNAIYLSDSDDEIWKKVKQAVTDPQRIRKDDPGRPEICTIFSYHKLFNAEAEPSIAEAALPCPTVDETAEACRKGQIGCVDCKKNLAAKLKAMLDPMRERRAYWENHIDDMYDILKEGTRRGCEEGNATVDRVKQAMCVDYWD